MGKVVTNFVIILRNLKLSFSTKHQIPPEKQFREICVDLDQVRFGRGASL